MKIDNSSKLWIMKWLCERRLEFGWCDQIGQTKFLWAHFFWRSLFTIGQYFGQNFINSGCIFLKLIYYSANFWEDFCKKDENHSVILNYSATFHLRLFWARERIGSTSSSWRRRSGRSRRWWTRPPSWRTAGRTSSGRRSCASWTPSCQVRLATRPGPCRRAWSSTRLWPWLSSRPRGSGRRRI